MGTGVYHSFENGYNFFSREILRERITYIYKCGAIGIPLTDVLPFAA